MFSSSPRIDAPTLSLLLASPLLPPFFDTHSLSISSLGYKASWIVISFFVFWSICRSSSIVHFKNGPEYLTGWWWTTQLFIFLIRFLLQSLVSRKFLVRLSYSFCYFFFPSRFFYGVCFQYSLELVIFFSQSVLIRSWFANSIPSVFCLFLLLIMNMAHFFLPNSIPLSWLYISIVFIQAPNSCAQSAGAVKYTDCFSAEG